MSRSRESEGRQAGLGARGGGRRREGNQPATRWLLASTQASGPRGSAPAGRPPVAARPMPMCCVSPPAAAGTRRSGRASRSSGGPRAAGAAAAEPAGPCLLLDLLDDALLSESIAALLSAHELGRLACASRRFTAEPPTCNGGGSGGGPAALSVVENAAALACGRHPRTVCGCAPPRATSWLRLLAELDAPAFTTADAGVQITERGKLVCGAGTALCDAPEMLGGVHRAEFTLIEACTASIGVVGTAFSIAGELPSSSSPQPVAQESLTLRSTLLSPHAWLFNTGRGRLYHAGRGADWPGRPKRRRKTAMVRGDSLGLELDLDRGTLTAVLNGKTLGVMVQRDPALVPPLRWCVHLEGGGGRGDGDDAAAPPPALRVCEMTAI
jgi:hypothetical protein